MLTHVYNGILFVLIPILINEFNTNIIHVGLIISIPKISSFISNLPIATISDKIGSKKTLTLCLIFTGISGLYISQSKNTTDLVLGLILFGVSFSMYHPPAMSIVSKLFPTENKSQAMGIHGVGGTLGSALGPITFSMVLSSMGWRFVYLIWAIPTLLFSIILYLILPGREDLVEQKTTNNNNITNDKEQETSYRPKLFALFLIFMFSWFLSKRIMQNFLTSYLFFIKDVDLVKAGWIFGFMSLIGPIATLTGGYMGDKLGEIKWLVVGLLGCLISILVVLYSPSFMLIIVGILSYGYFSNSHMGAAPSLVASFTPINRRALGYALYSIPGNVAGIIAPVLGAYFSELYGIEMSIFVSAMVLLIGFALMWTLTYFMKKNKY